MKNIVSDTEAHTNENASGELAMMMILVIVAIALANHYLGWNI